MKRTYTKWILSILLSITLLSGCQSFTHNQTDTTAQTSQTSQTSDAPEDILSDIPSYTGNPVYIYNDNEPMFTKSEITDDAYESYSDLDELGRVGTATACLGPETLPTEDREDISSVTPSGWINHSYDIVDGGYLYNRCHMIGFQLSGENDNEENLFTGTRYMNVDGMLPYENQTKEYIDETDNHVMYRVTPDFEDNNLVCDGVLMEAYSVEDNGSGLSFCIYVYNVQPDITIDYTTGENYTSNTTQTSNTSDTKNTTYILNTNSKIIHIPSCNSVAKMAEHNKKEYTGSYEALIKEGYHPCQNCNPEH